MERGPTGHAQLRGHGRWRGRTPECAILPGDSVQSQPGANTPVPVVVAVGSGSTVARMDGSAATPVAEIGTGPELRTTGKPEPNKMPGRLSAATL